MKSRALIAALVLTGCGASSVPAPGTVNGCAAGDFVTAADGGVARIQYGDPVGFAYFPKCLSVTAGQGVTFFGDPARGSNFAFHPLRPGGANGTDKGSSGNPIAPQNGGSTYTVVFPDAGTYGYFCQAHEGTGMYGAVQVK